MARLLEKIKTRAAQHAEWWKDYMTEMSILVISLAATFYGESLIQDYQDAQEDHQTMGMVVNELEYNAKTLEFVEEQYEMEQQFSAVLNRALMRNETFPQDTLDKYLDFHYDVYYNLWKHNAFDLIKLSGTMQRVEDKELSLHLFECYELLDVVKEMDAGFREERKKQRSGFIAELKDGVHASTTAGQWKQINEDIAFKHYLLYSMPSAAKTIQGNARIAREAVDNLITMIKKNYDLP